MPQTPWGELSIGDAHVHFFSHDFYAALARQKKVIGAEALAPLLQLEIPSPDAAGLASRWIAELDRHGVTRAALIASVPGDEHSVSLADLSDVEQPEVRVRPVSPRTPRYTAGVSRSVIWIL